MLWCFQLIYTGSLDNSSECYLVVMYEEFIAAGNYKFQNGQGRKKGEGRSPSLKEVCERILERKEILELLGTTCFGDSSPGIRARERQVFRFTSNPERSFSNPPPGLLAEVFTYHV
ncbi:hypothetical protein CB1_000391014 [Camelus ferus]|nr:hypothetical protein CB1_000391014 [Camelus ferus]